MRGKCLWRRPPRVAIFVVAMFDVTRNEGPENPAEPWNVE